MALIINAKKRRIMKKIFFAIVSTLLVAGCAKENLVEPMGPQNGVTVLTAGTPSTRTVLQNDQKVLWTTGDKINVNGVESNALELEEASATATFTIPGTLSNPYKAVFPASIYKDAQTVTLPAVQTYAEDSFGATAAPMAAYQASGNNLNFQHLCAVLKLTIEKAEDAHEIMYVEFSGKNDEQVSGDFAINYEDAALAGVSTAMSAKKVRCNVYEELSAEGLVVYLVVPAVEYSNGYTIKVVDTEGHYMEKGKASGQTLDAGKIYDMPAFTFEPDKTEFDVGITTAQEFIDFATNYNTGTKPAVAAILNDIEFTAQECADWQHIKKFEGTLKGNHHTISGFNTGKPIADQTTSTALIENLTVKGAATITAANGGNLAGSLNTRIYLATFVTRPTGGQIVNCHNKVDYTVKSCTIGQLVCIGGIVADPQSGGITVQDCVNYGNIEIASDFEFNFVSGTTTNHMMNVGGIVGRLQNKAIVQNCSSKGSMNILCKSSAYTPLYVGGIVGQYISGEIKGCVTYPAADADKATDGTHSATILFALSDDVSNNSAKVAYVGGISGNVPEGKTLENCTNNADIICKQPKGNTTYCGGVAGYSNGTISASHNKGAVSSHSTVTTFLGGLVGYIDSKTAVAGSTNAGRIYFDCPSNTCNMGGLASQVKSGASVNNCTNSGDVVLANPANNLACNMGGLIGINESQNVANLTNNGKVILEEFNGKSVRFVRAGGVIGLHQGIAIDGADAIKNNGEVIWNSAGGWSCNSFICLGGVCGFTSMNFKGCINNGKVLFNESSTGASGSKLYMGGVVGYTKASITIANCTNTDKGSVSFNPTAQEGDTDRLYDDIYVGGILGFSNEKVVAIDKCANAAAVSGGLSNCDNTGNDKHFGGIAGYIAVEGSSITECNMTGSVVNNDFNEHGAAVDGTTCGGIIGYANGTTISGCTVRNDSNPVLVKGLKGFVGGFAGALSGPSVLDGCTFKGALEGETATGLLAGNVAASESQIKNCWYLGTVNGMSSNDLVGSYADGVTVDLSSNNPLSE